MQTVMMTYNGQKVRYHHEKFKTDFRYQRREHEQEEDQQ